MSGRDNSIELEATGVRFYSQGDEDVFFKWLWSMPFVQEIVGEGRTIYIKIDPSQVDEDGLTDLLAIFRRYHVDMAQLVVFDREEFASWFRDADAPWHKEVFGSR